MVTRGNISLTIMPARAPIAGARTASPAFPMKNSEYFHGDNGAGLGASHQTGWTGVIARTMHLFATTTSEQVLKFGKKAMGVEIDKAAKPQPTTGATRRGKR
jgi:hypothetical protein